MTAEVYRYTFDRSIDIADIEAALVAAIVSAESLHGEAKTRLDAGHLLDSEKRRCVIDATTSVGRDLCLLFTGNLRRRIGEMAFGVRRISGPNETAANNNRVIATGNGRDGSQRTE